METKEIARNLNYFVDEVSLGYKGTIDLSLFSEASERLKELESEKENLIHYNADLNNQLNKAEFHIEKLKKQLSEQQPEWISVEDGKEMPDAISFTGICHDQFPRLVVAIDENRKVTHWMMLDAPKQKEPSFKDKFLEAFPKAKIEESIPKFCVEDVFPWVKYPHCNGRNCDKCWNQTYFEAEEKE